MPAGKASRARALAQLIKNSSKPRRVKRTIGPRIDCGFAKKILAGYYACSVYAFSVYLVMVFVELTPFVDFRDAYWTDDNLRMLQRFLLVQPDAGDLIRGGAGLRKLRWAAQGRVKRGGARVIYYWHDDDDRIYLIYGYVKSERENLTPEQVKVLAGLLKDL